MRSDAEFAAFARARGDRMLRVAWLITRHHEDARDAVQDALLGLHRSRARLPEGDALRRACTAAWSTPHCAWSDAAPRPCRWPRSSASRRAPGLPTLEGATFSVGQLVSTASGCAPHPNPGFHDALTSVTQLFTGVSHLSLTRADGMTVLGFRPLHPTDEEATDGVRLRLVNNTGRDIEAITLTAPDLTVHSGPLATGATSEELAPADRSTATRVWTSPTPTVRPTS